MLEGTMRSMFVLLLVRRRSRMLRAVSLEAFQWKTIARLSSLGLWHADRRQLWDRSFDSGGDATATEDLFGKGRI